MIDIIHKSNTLREATAEAYVQVGHEDTMQLIRENKIPKGNIFDMAKAAGLLGVKKTSDLLPDCHPLPIEFTGIEYEMQETHIRILVTVKTIYKTGVEVEAMHGASIVALTMYDMLKPVDKNVEISTIRLLKKSGGKSSFKKEGDGLKCHVVVCSDNVSAGKSEDRSGKYLVETIQQFGIASTMEVIPDDAEKIKHILEHVQSDLLIYSGGTGLGPRDLTTDTLAPLMDIRMVGVEEQMRSYGQERTPYAMFSRSLAGIQNKRIVLALPGSENGVQESISAIFPHILHVFQVLKGTRHDA
ncbi:MAG: bifunctional molybdenum cofactor biosynthesis protein MoaC/MoaB [Bacteroidetes bacterium]|nr:bifunctional molybdenum cofactor biosynthesis protein MoaC/MoaB [Bacteroidota bacterium]